MRRVLIAICAVLALSACGGKKSSSGGGGNPPPPPPPPAAGVNFSTYLGSNDPDFVRDVAVDGSGNVYAVGGTRSSDLPTTNGTFQPTFGGYEDAFVVKFNPQGQIIWSTYLGGAELDRAYAVELDHQGNVIVAGRCGASFPVTAGAVQTVFQGGATVPLYPHPQDGFVAKINAANGARMWATFFGATDDHASIVRDIAVDPNNGAIYLAASTNTGTYQTAAVLAAFQAGHRSMRIGGVDGVLAKLTNDGASMPWATYVGGSADDFGTPSVRIDAQGNPIVVFSSASTNAPTTAGAFQQTPGGMNDYYLAKFALDGPLIWATYVGGSLNEGTETHNLAIRTDGALVIAGSSRSTNFPTSAGAYDTSQNGNGGAGTGQGTNYPTDCAIAVISPAGSSLLAGTYYGGSVGEACEGIDTDSNGNVYVTGGAFSSDLPTTIGAYQTTKAASLSPFIAVFNRDLTRLRYGSFYGGSGDSIGRDIAVHSEAHFVFGGEMGGGYPMVNAVRSSVSAGEVHGGVTDITVTLGPG